MTGFKMHMLFVMMTYTYFFFFFTESIQLVTTPTNHPRSVLINRKNTKLEEFIMNIHNNMSTLRFILFMISILFGFAVIIGVLFIVPCKWSDCISSKNIKFSWSDSIFIDIGIFYIFLCINIILFYVTNSLLSAY